MMDVSLYRDGNFNSLTYGVSHVRIDVGEDRYVVTIEEGVPTAHRIENPRNYPRPGEPGCLPRLGPELPVEEP